jgi:thiol-disulfide isomerase/thioredoxin
MLRTLRHCVVVTPLLLGSAALCFAQASADGPTSPKAQKTFADAAQLEKKQMYSFALDAYRKADKQDDAQCAACEDKIVSLGVLTGDWKAAERASDERMQKAKTPAALVQAHTLQAQVELSEGRKKKQQPLFAKAVADCDAALAVDPKTVSAALIRAMSLSEQHQDAAAAAQFRTLLPLLPQGSPDHERVARYVADPALARERLVPNFAVTTLDGRHISMDSLKGNVVLLDFWATWCGPCREYLPHLQKIAQQFQGQPLVVLSVSLDKDDAAWRAYVAKHDMTWPQYRDGYWNGSMAHMFGIREIPQTFTIDADGVIENQSVGDADLTGKLRKLVAKAKSEGAAPPQSVVARATKAD